MNLRIRGSFSPERFFSFLCLKSFIRFCIPAVPRGSVVEYFLSCPSRNRGEGDRRRSEPT